MESPVSEMVEQVNNWVINAIGYSGRMQWIIIQSVNCITSSEWMMTTVDGSKCIATHKELNVVTQVC